jgi:hypothetical protein
MPPGSASFMLLRIDLRIVASKRGIVDHSNDHSGRTIVPRSHEVLHG